MKIVVLDALALGEDLDLSSFGELGNVEIYGSSTDDEIIERTRDCDVVITNKLKLNKTKVSIFKILKEAVQLSTESLGEI